MPRGIDLLPGSQRKVPNDPTARIQFDVRRFLADYPFDPSALEQAIIDGINKLLTDLLNVTGIDLGALNELAAQAQQSWTDLLAGLGVTDIDALIEFFQNPIGAIQGLIEAWQLPLVPVTVIGDMSLNLLANPLFDANSLADDADGRWSLVSDTFHGLAFGSVTATASAELLELLSTPATPVAPGQELALSQWVKWTGVAATGNAFQLGVTYYREDKTVHSAVDLATITAPSAASSNPLHANFIQMTGTHTVPAEVAFVRQRIAILPTVTAGQVWWSDASLKKTQLLSKSMTKDLVADLTAGLAYTQSVLDAGWQAMMGGFATGKSTTDFKNALKAVPDTNILGLSATKIFGLLGIGQVPTNLLGLSNIADLQHLTDNIVEYVFGGVYSGTGLPDARNALDTHWATTQSNAQQLAEIRTQQEGQSNSGISIHVEFGNHPNSAQMPNPAVLSNPGLGGWVTTYSATPGQGAQGTSTLGVLDGHTNAYLVNNGWRTMVSHHPVPTLTDYQRFTNVVQLGPAGGSTSWVLCRCNAANTEYVYVLVKEVGFLSYTAELGYVIGGTKTVMVPAKSIPAAADSRFLVGTGGGLRVYQFFVGNTLVFNHTEVGTVSKADDTHRFWGIRGDCNGTQALSQGVTMDMADNAPPAVVGSGATMSRRSTGLVGPSGTGPVVFPNNFFDNIVNRSADITPNLTNGTFTVSMAGWYECHASAKTTSSTLDTTFAMALFKNGSLVKLTGTSYRPIFVIGGSFMVYLEAGDAVSCGYHCNTASFLNWQGESTDAYTHFSIALVNRSYQ